MTRSEVSRANCIATDIYLVIKSNQAIGEHTAAAQVYLSNRNVKLQTTYKTQNGDKLRNNKTKPITNKKARNIHFQS